MVAMIAYSIYVYWGLIVAGVSSLLTSAGCGCLTFFVGLVELVWCGVFTALVVGLCV